MSARGDRWRQKCKCLAEGRRTQELASAAQRAARKIEVAQLRAQPPAPLDLQAVVLAQPFIALLRLAGELHIHQNSRLLEVRMPGRWSLVFETQEAGHITRAKLWAKCSQDPFMDAGMSWRIDDGGPIHPDLLRALVPEWAALIRDLAHAPQDPDTVSQAVSEMSPPESRAREFEAAMQSTKNGVRLGQWAMTWYDHAHGPFAIRARELLDAAWARLSE